MNARPHLLGLVLKEEIDDDTFSPELADILVALATLDPANGAGFACLAEDVDYGDYVQVAGGPDPETGQPRYCVERRIYHRKPDGYIVLPSEYSHLVAGVKSAGESIGETMIKTNGFKVDCRTNEVLTLAHVISIFGAFFEGRVLPEEFQWRSNRSEVDGVGKLSSQ